MSVFATSGLTCPCFWQPWTRMNTVSLRNFAPCFSPGDLVCTCFIHEILALDVCLSNRKRRFLHFLFVPKKWCGKPPVCALSLSQKLHTVLFSCLVVVFCTSLLKKSNRACFKKTKIRSLSAVVVNSSSFFLIRRGAPFVKLYLQNCQQA